MLVIVKVFTGHQVVLIVILDMICVDVRIVLCALVYEIKNTILNAVKNGDKRFIYNKNSKKLLILNDSFEDLI